ncbi:MAG TPA: hypothetical protein VFE63_20885 [Roseiarcus sp.]|jgi:hypothetical protein|nr:hypothetical protein [Roseiarcus sp.]
MSTVNPVQTATYYLSTSNNPITFGSGADINVSNGDGVYGDSSSFNIASGATTTTITHA